MASVKLKFPVKLNACDSSREVSSSLWKGEQRGSGEAEENGPGEDPAARLGQTTGNRHRGHLPARERSLFFFLFFFYVLHMMFLKIEVCLMDAHLSL